MLCQNIVKFQCLLIILNFVDISVAKFIRGKDGWSHEIDLEEENGLRIKWKNSPIDGNGERWLTMEVFAKTNGYIGLGFSPHGGMAGGDMVVGWVDSNGRPHLKDFYATANDVPILDNSQNYELLSAYEDEKGTRIQFQRKWDTCDENDMKIVTDTMRLIWAYSPFDPVERDNAVTNLQWHGSKSRGALSVFLLDDPFAAKFPDENDPHVKHWDMTMDDSLIEAEHTTYFCKIIKMPQLDKKHQMIGFKPILTPENKKNVHHITFYECYIPPEHGNTASVFEKHLNTTGGRCYTPNMPPEWTKHCVTFLFVWVAGSEGEMLPEHVGSALGEEHGGASYFMLETHYDNPELRTFRDNSGVRIYYTDKLRPNDGSVMLMGYRITPFLLLPPMQKNIVTYGICSAECTDMTIPEDGINVIISLVHAHLSGRKIRLRHFRNGKELPPIAEDNQYDFNYQQSRSIKNEIKILRGDELMVECEYETVDNNRIVLGGLSTKQEMCQTFFMYYPRINLMQCTSQYEFHDFFKGLNIDEVSGSVLNSIKMPYNPHLLPADEQAFDPPDNAKELEESGDGPLFKSMFDQLKIEAPNKWKGMTVGDYLKQANWTDAKFGKEVESKWRNGRHYAYCTGHGRQRIPLKNHIIPFPDIKEPLSKPVSNVCRIQSGANSTSNNNQERNIRFNDSILKAVSGSVKLGTTIFDTSIMALVVITWIV
ncbi:hypothetical protein Ocin01_02222 [Orchesella cincta]|uniref:DOMON domain-containing protein n=1 Tax=Orchesella cincta TaxID=48709 RepID=A0A1D2NGQ1_ORCCI|nr:hypothetical protein Ocin01_02222 [Orchesella cincta]